jgi:hypothetical protein
MSEWSSTEKESLLGFLDQLRDCMSNAGCNDFEVENTPENVAMLERAIRHSHSDKDADETVERLHWRAAKGGQKLHTTDFVLLGYLRSKLEETI